MAANDSGQERTDYLFGRWRMPGYRYGALLLVILASLIFQLAAPDADWARMVIILLQGVTLLMALIASKVHRWILRLAAVAVAIAVVSTAAALIGFGTLGPTAARGTTLLFVALAPGAIIRGVITDVRAHGVTLHAMFGVLCVYLLIGSLFAFLYGVVGSLDANPFFSQHAEETQKNFLYFSFVTITTVGYGDLTAASNLGRSLAIAEALTGQIYLVTVVATMVGGLGRSRRA